MKTRDQRRQELKTKNMLEIAGIWNQSQGNPAQALTGVGMPLSLMIEQILDREFGEEKEKEP